MVVAVVVELVLVVSLEDLKGFCANEKLSSLVSKPNSVEKLAKDALNALVAVAVVVVVDDDDDCCCCCCCCCCCVFVCFLGDFDPSPDFGDDDALVDNAGVVESAFRVAFRLAAAELGSNFLAYNS